MSTLIGVKGSPFLSIAAVNVLLGIPGVVFYWIIYFLMATWPLAHLGITVGDATEDEGFLSAHVICSPILLACFILWFLVNRHYVGKEGSHRFLKWACAFACTLVPTLILISYSYVW